MKNRKVLLLLILSLLLFTGCGEKKSNDKPLITIDIADVSVILECNDCEFNGSAIEPYVVATYKSPDPNSNEFYTLEKDKDYEVKYFNNTDPGTAMITMTGKGMFIGTRIIEFQIIDNRKTIDTINISGINESYYYSGSPITPSPIVEMGIETLVVNRDYKLTYYDNKDVGKATIVIEGINSYKGKKIVNFEIKEREVLSINCRDNVVYNGTAQAIATCHNGKITQNAMATDAGSYEVICVSSSDGTTTTSKNCTINPADISTATVVINNGDIPTYDETKSAIQLTTKPVVKLNNKTLVENTDYTVRLTNNIEPGAAMVVINGVGNYTGQKQAVAFYIKSSSCGKKSSKMEITDLIRPEKDSDLANISYERTKDNELLVRVRPGSTVKLIIKIPPICGKVEEWASGKSVPDYNNVKDWVTLSAENDVHTADGGMEYTLIITRTTKQRLKSHENGYKFNPYRTYKLAGNRQGINFTALIRVVDDFTSNTVTRADKMAACGKVENASTTWRSGPQTVCVYCSTCIKNKYCQYYGGSSKVSTDKITIVGKNGVSKDCPVNVFVKPATYTCTLNYDSKNNKLTITGQASDGTRVSQTKIDGVVTSSITPTTSKTYNGTVTFANGKVANCSKAVTVPKPTYSCTLTYDSNNKKLTLTGSNSNGASIISRTIDGISTSTLVVTSSKTYNGVVRFADGSVAYCSKAVTVGRCCCIEGNYGCTWSTSACSSIGRTERSLSQSQCTSGSTAPSCNSVSDNKQWTTASSVTVTVWCDGCATTKNTKTFYAGNSDITTGIVTVKGINGQTKSCTVNVYLRRKGYTPTLK